MLFAIVVGALVALLWRQAATPAFEAPSLTYITTAHQLGVVGYRDPAGAISPDGKKFAYSEGRFIRVIPIGGGAPVTLPPAEMQVRFLAWTSNDTVVAVPRLPASTLMPDGKEACITDRRLVIPCGGAKLVLDPDVDVYGPIAFGARDVYFASPHANGMVALWSADLRSKMAHRLSAFSRDAYAPSVGGNIVVFKTQTYRTFLADVPASGGATRQLTTFQSETPSYHPSQPLLAFTYGTWRRVLDDGRYPDIAQDIGVIDPTSTVPADAPSSVIAKSESEDQAMTWSPNGKWIAFHSHREMSDDVWLRPVDGSRPDKRVTFLGRGAEAGWPRWSPNGKFVLISSGKKGAAHSGLYIIGIDQESGATTADLREIETSGFEGDITHAEWRGNNEIVAVAKVAPGQHAIISVPASGGAARVIHRYATEHDFSGVGISPDGKYLAFTAPAADGYYQIFTITTDGKATPLQLTSDPSNKTQPAFSSDGSRVAFTVWSYDAVFWSFHAR